MRRDEHGFHMAARYAARMLKSARDVLIVGHNDADGLTATAIASIALDRAGVENETMNVKKLDEAIVSDIERTERDVIWLVDLGSGYLSMLDPERRYCISDHHAIDPECMVSANGQREFSRFFCEPAERPNVNPMPYGIDGSREISGAGCTYLVAVAMDKRNRDLSALAIVGALGDFQDNADARLVGCNRRILETGVELGVLSSDMGLRPYGPQTRPLAKWLELCTDPYIRGISRNRDACQDLLGKLGISEIGDDGRLRVPADLDEEETRKLSSALVEKLNDPSKLWRLIGEVVELPQEREGTPLRNGKEYATLLNSCGRYGHYEVALAVLKGDRDDALEQALGKRKEHSQNIAKLIDAVKRMGVTPRENVQWFDTRHLSTDVRDDIGDMDTIVGIVAGMLLGSRGDRREGIKPVPGDVPILAFAESDDGGVKVSARGDRKLVRRGLDLSTAMRQASASVGGSGGGHKVAAGATIPASEVESFLENIDAIVYSQLNPSARA